MNKISTDAMNRIENLKGDQLTIGLDLGDRFSHYCILNASGEVIAEHHLATTPKGIDEVFGRSDRTGNGNPFALGQPAINPVGARSDRRSRAQCATDRGQ